MNWLELVLSGWVVAALSLVDSLWLAGLYPYFDWLVGWLVGIQILIGYKSTINQTNRTETNQPIRTHKWDNLLNTFSIHWLMTSSIKSVTPKSLKYSIYQDNGLLTVWHFHLLFFCSLVATGVELCICISILSASGHFSSKCIKYNKCFQQPLVRKMVLWQRHNLTWPRRKVKLSQIVDAVF